MTQRHPEEWVPRKSVLTEEDLNKIAEAVRCGNCQFNRDEADTLKKFASSVNKTQRIASWVIITGIVGSVLSGTYHAIKYYIVNVIMKDGVR